MQAKQKTRNIGADPHLEESKVRSINPWWRKSQLPLMVCTLKRVDNYFMMVNIYNFAIIIYPQKESQKVEMWSFSSDITKILSWWWLRWFYIAWVEDSWNLAVEFAKDLISIEVPLS